MSSVHVPGLSRGPASLLFARVATRLLAALDVSLWKLVVLAATPTAIAA